jgi:sugar/nucleoside kinase (ribokinase family)
MGLLVVGSIAFDDVETPFDKVENVLGGSSPFICMAASYFDKPVHMIGVVGDDFGQEHVDMMKNYGIDMEGLEILEGEKTLKWSGRYHYDLNQRDTIFTELNALEKFNPIIPENQKKCKFVVISNIDPKLQLKVLDQLGDVFSICDTMNYWIERKLDDLLKVLKRINVLTINESEARLLAKEANLVKAAKIILEMGPKYLVIKKGEHGALLFSEDRVFFAPAYPLENIFDPTGAGDSFAGGFAGYLQKTKDTSFENMKRAVVYGSTMASFCVEQFSVDGLKDLSAADIYERFIEFKQLSAFEDEQ